MNQGLLDSLKEAKVLCQDVLDNADDWIEAKDWAMLSKTLRSLHYVVWNRSLFGIESEWRKEVGEQ